MDNNLSLINEKKIERTIKALEKNDMNGYFVKSREELIEKVKELTPKGSLVSCGGSVSLFETKVIDLLRSGDYTFLDRYDKDLDEDGIKEVFRKSFYADVYFTSTNAITEDGELYNVDRTGNRVAAMLYGPDKVIVICGINKIVKDINDAVNRNKYIAAPANAVRLDTKTPCKTIGYCVECSSPERICGEYTVIRRQRDKDRIHVIFLNENIGY